VQLVASRLISLPTLLRMIHAPWAWLAR